MTGASPNSLTQHTYSGTNSLSNEVQFDVVKTEQLGNKKNLCITVNVKDCRIIISKQGEFAGGTIYPASQSKQSLSLLIIVMLHVFLVPSCSIDQVTLQGAKAWLVVGRTKQKGLHFHRNAGKFTKPVECTLYMSVCLCVCKTVYMYIGNT